MAALQRLMTSLRNALPSRNKVRDQPPRRGHYDGTEKPDLVPPNRYARGEKATPALPPTAM